MEEREAMCRARARAREYERASERSRFSASTSKRSSVFLSQGRDLTYEKTDVKRNFRAVRDGEID